MEGRPSKTAIPGRWSSRLAGGQIGLSGAHLSYSVENNSTIPNDPSQPSRFTKQALSPSFTEITKSRCLRCRSTLTDSGGAASQPRDALLENEGYPRAHVLLGDFDAVLVVPLAPLRHPHAVPARQVEGVAAAGVVQGLAQGELSGVPHAHDRRVLRPDRADVGIGVVAHSARPVAWLLVTPRGGRGCSAESEKGRRRVLGVVVCERAVLLCWTLVREVACRKTESARPVHVWSSHDNNTLQGCARHGSLRIVCAVHIFTT